ncbi:MAG TPA: EcsC family protein [Bacillus sp. (in: firmicutes)]|uniref:EcsC family protein n=1 Tax=Bacillus litorisediminis TaxID=2922713 RepID=UPI001FAB7197|nr:EcsC family protein [Bacillus litorisediminis]HWO76954.1 EcsC family protein [Bacillus sp. (in: firmicutes)]
MTDYEQRALAELEFWKMKQTKKSSSLNRTAKRVQTKINQWIPKKIHTVITEGIKGMVQTALAGSSIKSIEPLVGVELEQREKLALEKVGFYKKTAAIEGAGTGAGGIFLGLADFPLLLSIKLKFLYDVSSIYGYDPKEYENRIYILYVFLLAFSSDEKRKETLTILEDWEDKKEVLMQLDWQTFQQEYRDYLDIKKLLQLVPGIGAIVGFYVNYQLLDQLGETAKFAYRMRYFRV